MFYIIKDQGLKICDKFRNLLVQKETFANSWLFIANMKVYHCSYVKRPILKPDTRGWCPKKHTQDAPWDQLVLICTIFINVFCQKSIKKQRFGKYNTKYNLSEISACRSIIGYSKTVNITNDVLCLSFTPVHMQWDIRVFSV